ncbi:endolytic transglycosylase MltG [Clostridium oryzae]|uniref:Endolytic murein transglycosylase n=1 Tax=Clostridium oryzae TaxID=1450648 RepID=A0A1V4IR30_9CLOT|nr:endolytic transglycosylase MltG [Clostridium oryzae]OPJ62396.1 putative aminodeoxychorismate lyase [Clostridium oryzae]
MKRKFFIFTLGFIVMLVLLSFLGLYMYSRKMNTATLNNGAVYFMLQEKTSINDTAQKLKDREIISSANKFVKSAAYYKIKGPFNASNLIIKAHTPMKDLLNKLRTGKSDFAKITIPEGLSLFSIEKILEQNRFIVNNKFLNAKYKDFDYNRLLAINNDVKYDLEGYLFPDTYYIPVSYSEKDIINLMYQNFSRVMNQENLSKAKKMGFNTNQIITVASLIEKEAANDSERRRIAGVIYNRLKKDMPLQIDATVIYAKTFGKYKIQRVLYKDLKVNSKYNTYKYEGLPPGPIASPGKASIEAALNPEKNSYLYYVKGPSGHIFSKTYSEHLKNVNKYISK